jgi:hypothetical protein
MHCFLYMCFYHLGPGAHLKSHKGPTYRKTVLFCEMIHVQIEIT